MSAFFLYYTPKGRVLNRLDEIEIMKHKNRTGDCESLKDPEHVLFDNFVTYIFGLLLEW